MQQIYLTMCALWEKKKNKEIKFLFHCFVQLALNMSLYVIPKYDERFRVPLHCSSDLEECKLISCPSLSRYLCISSGNLNTAQQGKKEAYHRIIESE